MIPSRNRKTLAELIRHAGGEPSPVLVRWALNTRRASYGARAGMSEAAIVNVCPRKASVSGGAAGLQTRLGTAAVPG